jgi:hypothetical protein
MKYDFNALLIAAVLMLAVSQTLDGMTTPLARFLHGLLIGLSIVCSVTGLVLYTRASRKG